LAVDAVVSKRATELERLAEFLDRNRLAENPNELRKAASQLRSSAKNGVYSYHFENVFFALEAPRHPVPRGVTGIRAELRVKVDGVLDEDADDQYSVLCVNVILTGTTKSGTAMFAWHLDRDDGATKSDDLHPRYHFQHAGIMMRAQEDQWGQSLLVDPPRLMHPPLDGLLAVDFVLGAYLAKRYQNECVKDATYTNLISIAQRRAWTGFARAVASFNDSDSDWHKRCSPYWPQVLPR
jgi:hypothetical protein